MHDIHFPTDGTTREKRQSLRILVVDGAPSDADAMSSALARRGHVVAVAHGVQHALEHPFPDVVVADLDLPDATAFELVSAFHSRGAHPRAVLVGRDPSVEDCRRALRIGAVDLLTRPVGLDELLDAVERAPAMAPRFDDEPSAFERVYSSTPPSCAAAARDVVAFALRARIGPGCRARIGSAVSEIVDNARRHGYAGRRGWIRVRAEATETEFHVRVDDRGAGFDTDELELESSSNSVDGGLARALALCEEIHIDARPDHGASIEMRFDRASIAFADDTHVDLSELDYLTPDLARKVLHSLSRRRTSDVFQLSPSLAVVVGRLLSGPDSSATIRCAARS